jgi:hypothetical protein
MSLLNLFHWFEATSIASYGRRSNFFFPAIEVVHLLGLTLLLGAVLLINLRRLNMLMRHQSAADVICATRLGLGVTLASGTLLFVTEAIKCYYNVAFWYKMGLLLAAVVLQAAIEWRLRDSTTGAASTARAAALLSLTLWFGVGIAGRAIAFV